MNAFSMIFSQSLTAQLFRMAVLLGLTIVLVNNSPWLLDLLAQQAVDSGCHQTIEAQIEGDRTSHSFHQHHHHHNH